MIKSSKYVPILFGIVHKLIKYIEHKFFSIKSKQLLFEMNKNRRNATVPEHPELTLFVKFPFQRV